MLVKPQSAVPMVDVTVDLLSRVLRPYLFRVNAVGKPPHEHRRSYTVRADSDDSAAMKGIELFIKEFTTAQPIREMPTLAPKAVRE